jgi:hypothetical protein
VITFAFGLVHGFGFSYALRETLQFAGSHLLTSLLSFNLGVELGQLLVLVLMIPALDLLFKYAVAERMGTIILSAFVAHTGWHWFTERGEQLLMFPVPALDLAALAALMWWLTLLVAAAGIAWFVSVLLKRRGVGIGDQGSGIGGFGSDAASVISDPRSPIPDPRQASD